MKNICLKIKNSIIALFIAAIGVISISSCGLSSMSSQDAYDAGYSIGRLIGG